jgi:hypothetical protein
LKSYLKQFYFISIIVIVPQLIFPIIADNLGFECYSLRANRGIIRNFLIDFPNGFQKLYLLLFAEEIKRFCSSLRFQA